MADLSLESYENQIFQKNIDLLKTWRKDIWTHTDTIGFLAPFLGDIVEMKYSLCEFRTHASDSVYEEFLNEYNKTVYLLYKTLLHITTCHYLPASSEDQSTIFELLAKLKEFKFENEQEIITELRQETDLITRIELRKLNIPEDKITEIINTGYTVGNVLDEDYDANFKL